MENFLDAFEKFLIFLPAGLLALFFVDRSLPFIERTTLSLVRRVCEEGNRKIS